MFVQRNTVFELTSNTHSV